jgi:hypothetical protein
MQQVGGGIRTIRVPDIAKELHGWWHERVVLGKLELGGKDATLVRCALRPLDKRLPYEQVVLVHRPGGDAIGRIGGEVLVLLEEPL